MQNMETNSSNMPMNRKPLRLLPGIVIAVMLALVSYGLPLIVPDNEIFGFQIGFLSAIGGVLCALGVIVWWLALSRAPWIERLGAILLMAGTKGKRYALPHARVMVHQPMGETQGQSSDIEIYMNEIVTLKQHLNQIIVEKTGQPLERIEKDTDRNFFMSATQAKDYGIIDEILVRTKK